MLNLQRATLKDKNTVRLSQISAQTRPGSLIGILGENGAGKTTLLQCLCGFLPLTNGHISFKDQSIFDLSPHQRQTHISYLSAQIPPIWHQTAENILDLSPFPQESFHQDVLEVAPLLTRPMHLLSSGQQKRVLLTLSLNHPGPLYLLDEPLAHLDLRHQHYFMKRLKNLSQMGKTIILSLHDPLMAAHYCSTIWILEKGHLLQEGPPKDTLTPALMERVFGLPPSHAMASPDHHAKRAFGVSIPQTNTHGIKRN